MFTKSKPKKSGLTLDRHFVFIEAPVELVGPEAVLWGESAWWPKKSAMQFRKTSAGDLAVGATYEMRLVRPIPQAWQVEVTRYVPGHMVERMFKKGFFKGQEIVRAEERSNGTRVEYELHYAFSSPFHSLLWDLVCHKMHDANIMKNLEALKLHCMKKMEQDV